MTSSARLVLLLVALLTAAVCAPSSALALSSVVQDDALLLSGDPAKVDKALDQMEAIGFTHVR